MWTSDLNFVEIARTLLKHGADVEMGAARVSKFWIVIVVVIIIIMPGYIILWFT